MLVLKPLQRSQCTVVYWKQTDALFWLRGIFPTLPSIFFAHSRFYEWKVIKGEKEKEVYYVRPEQVGDQPTLWEFAGLYSSYRDPVCRARVKDLINTFRKLMRLGIHMPLLPLPLLNPFLASIRGCLLHLLQLKERSLSFKMVCCKVPRNGSIAACRLMRRCEF